MIQHTHHYVMYCDIQSCYSLTIVTLKKKKKKLCLQPVICENLRGCIVTEKMDMVYKILDVGTSNVISISLDPYILFIIRKHSQVGKKVVKTSHPQTTYTNTKFTLSKKVLVHL